jgi:hypothetical protein
MRFVTTERRAANDAEWNARVRELLRRTVKRHGGPARCCAGIDLRVTYGFVRREVLGADACMCAYDDDEADPTPRGYAFWKQLNPRCLYLTLIGSFVPGTGSQLMATLRAGVTGPDVCCVALRATDAALSFYLKLGCVLVDFNALYVSGMQYQTDAALTTELCKRVAEGSSLQPIRDVLCMRDWCDHDTEEWPLLLACDARPQPRVAQRDASGRRRSARLSAMRVRAFGADPSA